MRLLTLGKGGPRGRPPTQTSSSEMVLLSFRCHLYPKAFNPLLNGSGHRSYLAGLISPSTPSSHTRHWLRLVCVLLTDKSAEMRRASTEAVEVLYTLVDPAVVSSYASYATGPEAVSSFQTTIVVFNHP